MSAPAQELHGHGASGSPGMPGADAGSRAGSARAWWRRHKFWLIAGVLFVAVTGAGIIAGTTGGRSTGALSITNPGPSGGQAAASVLRRQGVDVTASDSLQATRDALKANGPGTSTVLLFDPGTLLSKAQVSELAAAATATGAKVVAVTPGPLAVRGLSAELSSAGSAAVPGTAVAANCSNADAQAAGRLGLAGVPGLSGSPDRSGVQLYTGPLSCFPPDGKAGAPGVMATAIDVTLLGSTAILDNDGLARQGNAALAFRLLGSRPHLIWYTASLKDVPVAAQPPSLADLTPPWVLPASAWLLLVAVLGMIWRGRRSGPLVAEPLPVLVKASETVTGRARLYQDARAVDTAAATLRRATLTRLARVLRLGAGAAPEAVAAAVAERTGRPLHEVSDLLLGAPPRNEPEMLAIAARLAALEEEVAPR